MSDTDISEDRKRAWLAVVLMVPLLAVFMLPTVFLFDLFADDTDGWVGLGYALMVFMVYIGAVLIALPIFAHTLSFFIDKRTRHLTDLHAATIFGWTATALGSIIATPMIIAGPYGLLPFVTFCLAPGLAAFVTRLLLRMVMEVKSARITAYVVAALMLVPFVVAGVAGLIQVAG